MESFIGHLHEFHNPVRNTPVFVPAELPPRYAINFVPAVSSPVSPELVPDVQNNVVVIPVSPIGPAPSTDYSIISSVNFVPVSSSPSCIGPTQ